jgi:hypothetical protein
MSANVVMMCDVNSRPNFPALRQPDETSGLAAWQSISAKVTWCAVLFKQMTPTVPYVELLLLLGFLALVFV